MTIQPEQEKTKGKLIVFEGIDGSGKSTQAKMLADALKKQGHSVILTAEPTDTNDCGVAFRRAVTEGNNLAWATAAQLLLQDRAAHVRDVIAPAMEEGKIVICDRYYYSMAVYQGTQDVSMREYMDGLYRGKMDIPQSALANSLVQKERLMKEIISVNELFAPVPDLVLFCSVLPGVALLRIGARGKSDSFETREKLECHAKAYHAVMRCGTRGCFVNANLEPNLVHREVTQCVSEMLDWDESFSTRAPYRVTREVPQRLPGIV